MNHKYLIGTGWIIDGKRHWLDYLPGSYITREAAREALYSITRLTEANLTAPDTWEVPISAGHSRYWRIVKSMLSGFTGLRIK